MQNKTFNHGSDSERLKQINLELGGLKHKHNTCRMNSRFFGVLAAVLLTASVVGLIHQLLADDTDWAMNPDSPVYKLATEKAASKNTWLPMLLIGLGIAGGLGMIYKARHNCASQRGLWDRETSLRGEMQSIRDKLYIRDAVKNPEPHRLEHPPASSEPLSPSKARDEYIGTYKPPSAHEGSE